MKGTLKKLEDQWCVIHSPFFEDGEQWHEATPLHPISSEIDSNKAGFTEDSEVEFDLVTKETHPDLFKDLDIKEAAVLSLKKKRKVKSPVKTTEETPNNNGKSKIITPETKKLSKIKQIMNKEVSISLPKISFNTEDFKKTLTSLHNLFYGCMIFMFFFVIYLLHHAYGFYFLLAPVGYIVICYIGKFTKPYLKKVFRDESVS